jgi:hypothetical protein
LDWDSINTREWGLPYDPTGETKRKKQSEFLAQRRVDWKHILGIGVRSQACADIARDVIQGVADVPYIGIKREWYY